jgi:putative thioredoxin
MTSDIPVFDVSVHEFERRVLDASRRCPVLVDFWADWCAPCQALAPVLEAIAIKYAGQLLVTKVNSDRENELAAQLGVRSLPTVMLFVDGAVVDQFVGAQSGAAIEQFIAPFMPRPSDEQRAAAAALRSQGNDEDAARLLREAAESDPDNLRVRADLAAVYLDLEQSEEADTVLSRLPAGAIDDPVFRRLKARASLLGLAKPVSPARPDTAAARAGAAAAKALAGETEPALEDLMAVLRRSTGADREPAQTALRAIFELLGEDHELVGRYRRKMASALH